jgi:hypothetical protein
MSSETKEEAAGRREFLKASAAAVIGFGCIGNIRGALAQAKLTGKPLLLPQNVNAFIASNQGDKKLRVALAAEAKANLKAFINKHFHLTPEQVATLDGLSARQMRVVHAAIDRAAGGTRVQMQITGSGAFASEVRYTEQSGSVSSAAQSSTPPTKQDPSGGGSDGGVTIEAGCGSIDPKTGTAKDCKGSITFHYLKQKP